ncbi:hypothetical protein [Peribacillus asahii]|uniref:hypothetical protein n=1 Tax=Peribacillus asahii TaxID=228899 RepID=UPI00207A8291|nr:hypothetical protein [Peribacillus asahii]USK68406.1 hypothetical protein LIS76_12320 [Peribacillus asahii]
METKNRTIYSLQIMKNDQRNSFDYETEDEAYKAYKFLEEKYKNNIIIDKESVNFAKDIIQLSISKATVGPVLKGLTASFTPYEWFKDVYEEIILSATEYHENNK